MINDDVLKAAEVLRNGGIILYPTDTVWGLGCDATNARAVDRLFALKGRNGSKSMLVLVDSVEMAARYLDDLCDVARDIMDLSSSPVTLVLDDAHSLAPGVINEDRSVGFRLTREPWSAALCQALGRPVVSTSANFSGNPAPAFFPEIDPELVAKVDYSATSRREISPMRPRPSSIIKISRDSVVKILRP